MDSRCRPRSPRRMGQRFLRSYALASRIVSGFCEKYRRVFEIGCGAGIFTRILGEKCEVVSIDVDYSMALCTHHNTLSNPKILLVNGDALRPPIDFTRVDAVFGSIPYTITSPIIEMLVKYIQKPALLILQREVAERLAAPPGAREYGRLSVLVQVVYEVQLGEVISPKFFTPPPRVYSQVVTLIPRRKLDDKSIECVERLTRCIFSERRKKAVKILKKCSGKPSIKISDDIRVYQLEPGLIEKLAREWCLSRNEQSNL